MKRQVLLALVLTAMVGLAGCTGGTQNGVETTDGATADGDDGAALQSETATVSGFSYPEGASASGIESAETLLDEHESALAGRSVTLTGNKTFGVGGSSASASGGFSYSIAHDPDEDATVTTFDGRISNTTVYTEAGTKYYRTDTQRGTEYGSASADTSLRDTGPDSYTGRQLLRTMLAYGDYEATDVVTRNGTELVRYDLQQMTQRPDEAANIGDDASVNGTIYVDSDGIIHDASVSLSTGSEDGLSFTYDSTVQFTEFDSTTVEEPDWVSRAR